jgi:hypothetical protein
MALGWTWSCPRHDVRLVETDDRERSLGRFIRSIRAESFALALMVSVLLPGCDDFQEFVVQNPCPFEVSVAFAGTNPPPDRKPWPFAETVPASSEKRIVTGAPAGPYPHEQRIQIRARGHRIVVETVNVTQDGIAWRIPESFCRP